MSSCNIFCPGGQNSQTGTAVKERYKDALIHSCGAIPDPLKKLDSEDGPFVIPIWNSHEGEVKKASYIWDCIQEAKLKITDLWAKSIDFWHVRRSGNRTSHGKVGSVIVAGTQCSGFLKRENLVLAKCELTTVAFEQYKGGALWDGVLVAPGQGRDEHGFEVVAEHTANPNNFTSFVRFIAPKAFDPLRENVKSWLTGVKMPAFRASLGEAELGFFDQLLDQVSDLKDCPKLIFVFDRDAKVGLLFEGAQLYAGDLLDAEQIESGEISVYETSGGCEKPYGEELQKLFEDKFSAMLKGDFILHQGVNTCLFACPPLGLYTHGYKAELVEPVVRFYISKLFALWNDEVLKCTVEQSAFFERHKDAWLEERSKFMEFQIVTATDE
jgi:hypothetical protein